MSPDELFQYKKQRYHFLESTEERLRKTDKHLIREQINLQNNRLSEKGVQQLDILHENKSQLALHVNRGNVHRYLSQFKPDFQN